MRSNRVASEGQPQRDGRPLVEKDTHGDAGRLRYGETSFCVREHRFDVTPLDPGEPCEEVVDGGTALEILEERLHWNARVAEQPRAAESVGSAFDCWTFIPVEHWSNLRPWVSGNKGRNAAELANSYS